MNYMILGVGGIGGSLGGFLAKAGKDVTLLARGKTLEALRTEGLYISSGIFGEFGIEHPKAAALHEITTPPDVIFVCVKGYSIEDAAAILEAVAAPSTIIIPLLNIFGTGEKLRQRLPGLHILDGCIYVTAFQQAPGRISQNGKLFRVIFGEADGSISTALSEIATDLEQSGITPVLSAEVETLCFRKYCFISATAAAGAYFDATMSELFFDPEKRSFFEALTGELLAIAEKKGISLPDALAKNLRMLETAPAGATTSLQKDLARGGSSEIDGLLGEPIRLGKALGIATPAFSKVAVKLGCRPQIDENDD